MHTADFWENLQPHADLTLDTKAVLEDLCQNHEVSFVTARPFGRKASLNWLNRYLIVQAPQVFLTPLRKVMALCALEPEVIVEDSARNLLDFSSAERDYNLPKCEKILVSRPYNTVWHASCRAAGITIVDSTNDALRLAQKVGTNA